MKLKIKFDVKDMWDDKQGRQERRNIAGKVQKKMMMLALLKDGKYKVMKDVVRDKEDGKK